MVPEAAKSASGGAKLMPKTEILQNAKKINLKCSKNWFGKAEDGVEWGRMGLGPAECARPS